MCFPSVGASNGAAAGPARWTSYLAGGRSAGLALLARVFPHPASRVAMLPLTTLVLSRTTATCLAIPTAVPRHFLTGGILRRLYSQRMLRSSETHIEVFCVVRDL